MRSYDIIGYNKSIDHAGRSKHVVFSHIIERLDSCVGIFDSYEAYQAEALSDL